MRTTSLVVPFVFLFACGDEGGSTTKMDAPVHHDEVLAIDAPMPDGSTVDAPAGTVALTVKNYLNWCSVTVNGGAASSGAQQVVNVQPGAITLTAKRASASFEVSGNMWHHTDGDTNNMGEPGTITNAGDPATKTSTATATVVAGTPKCVWVCCPFAGGSGCENTIPEQCN